MKPTRLVLSAFLMGTLALGVGCDSTEPDDDGPGEEELIDFVQLTLTNTDDPSDVVTATATNTDGLNGPGQLQVETLTLAAGTTYNGTITLRSTEENELINEEVEEEAEEHQFFYTVTGGLASSVTFSITDRESDYGDNDIGADLPVGLEFTVTVNPDASGAGSVRIQLGHYDEGPKDGTTLSDETDVDFEMPIQVN